MGEACVYQKRRISEHCRYKKESEDRCDDNNRTIRSGKGTYREIGVDTDAALKILKKIPISLHCWQGDDVGGFDQRGPLTGGIQATGNYPGKARTPEELMADIDEVLALAPGRLS